MPGLPTATQGLVRGKLTQGVPTYPDAMSADERFGNRGERFGLNLFPGMQAAAVERSYYTATFQPGDSTRGTGLAFTVATGVTYLNTQALLIVQNTNPPGGPDVIMDWLSMKFDTAITAGTFWHAYHVIDNISRYSSGGKTLLAYNADGVAASGVLMFGSAPVATAPSGNVRDVGYNLLANGILVANAVVVVRYGRLDGQASNTFTTPTTAVAQSTVDAPPVVIPPGSSYVLNEFQTARTASGIGELLVGIIVR